MKVTFFSNFLNHHQLPFCLEMIKHIGGNFKFVATEKIPEDRVALGYDDMNNLYDFVVRSYEDETEAYKLGLESDVVIIGSAPSKYISERLKLNKLTFRYSERIFKNGFNFKTYLSLIKNYTLKESKNVYLLCASAYSSRDFNIAGAYINKTYKWGYFPEVKKYDLEKIMMKKNKTEKINILWVGRIIKYKHPEKVIEISKRLKQKNIDFHVKIVGIGDLYDEINNLIKINKLEKNVQLLGAVNNKLVRKYMEEANIFMFTSDYEEGWGAVLNEAMNSACAVVASHAIGAVPFVIEDNKNGIIYDNDDINDLYNKIEDLINNKKKINKIGIEAYKSMHKYWNANYATNELLKLCHKLLNNETYYSKNGPISKAIPLSNKKMYNYLMEKNND